MNILNLWVILGEAERRYVEAVYTILILSACSRSVERVASRTQGPIYTQRL